MSTTARTGRTAAVQADVDKVMATSTPPHKEIKEKDATGPAGAPGESRQDEPAAGSAANTSQASNPESKDADSARVKKMKKKKKSVKSDTPTGDAVTSSVHDPSGVNIAVLNTSAVNVDTQSDPTTSLSIPSRPADPTPGADQLTPGAGGGGFGGGATTSVGAMSGLGAAIGSEKSTDSNTTLSVGQLMDQVKEEKNEWHTQERSDDTLTEPLANTMMQQALTAIDDFEKTLRTVQAEQGLDIPNKMLLLDKMLHTTSVMRLEGRAPQELYTKVHQIREFVTDKTGQLYSTMAITYEPGDFMTELVNKAFQINDMIGSMINHLSDRTVIEAGAQRPVQCTLRILDVIVQHTTDIMTVSPSLAKERKQRLAEQDSARNHDDTSHVSSQNSIPFDIQQQQFYSRMEEIMEVQMQDQQKKMNDQMDMLLKLQATIAATVTAATQSPLPPDDEKESSKDDETYTSAITDSESNGTSGGNGGNGGNGGSGAQQSSPDGLGSTSVVC